MPANRLLLIVLLMLLVTSASFSVAIFFTNRQREKLPKSSAPAPQREISDPTFTDDGYIKPMDYNGEGSIYSKRASVRGKVQTWEKGSVKVWVGTTLRDAKLPKQVNLRCFSEYIVSKSGEKMKTSDAWLDINNMTEPGPKVKTETLQQRFSEGADIVIAVHVGKNDVMTAYQVVGYGCREVL